jgi:hypothetical protein
MLPIQLTAAHGHAYIARSFAEADALLRRLGAKPARLAGQPLMVSVQADGLPAPIVAAIDTRTLGAAPVALRAQLMRELQDGDLAAAMLLRRLATLH